MDNRDDNIHDDDDDFDGDTWDDSDDFDDDEVAGAEDAVMIGGYPTCPACGDSLFIPHHSDDRLAFCDRDATLIRLRRLRRH